MPIFNFLKKSKTRAKSSGKAIKKRVLIDKTYTVEVPTIWNQIESDRFRMTNKSNSLLFSVTNYLGPLDDSITSMEEMLDFTNPLFKKFVNEGGFISHNDQIVGDDYVYAGFKVDDETQYYYYTFRVIGNHSIFITFILRDIGDYKQTSKELLKEIGESINFQS